MTGAAGKAFHHEVQQPRQADAYSAANPAQGETLAQQVSYQGSPLLRNNGIVGTGAKLALAIFTLMILFAIMGMAILLESG